MNNSQGTYDELVDRYGTLTLGRCVLWIVLLVLFCVVLANVRRRDSPPRFRHPRTYLSGPYSQKGTIMFIKGNPLRQVTVFPGHDEPRNLAPRVLFASVNDFSGSMTGYFRRLHQAWRDMVAELNKEPETHQRVLLACCAFDDEVAFRDFAPLEYYGNLPLNFRGGGQTHLATALLTTIKRTRACRERLSAEGITPYRSLCAVITDGCASDREQLPQAILQIRQAEERREIDFVPIAPTARYVDPVEQIFGKEPIMLDQLDCEQLFKGFAKSLFTYSRSMCGAEPDARTLIADHLDDLHRHESIADPHPPRRLPDLRG